MRNEELNFLGMNIDGEKSKPVFQMQEEQRLK